MRLHAHAAKDHNCRAVPSSPLISSQTTEGADNAESVLVPASLTELCTVPWQDAG